MAWIVNYYINRAYSQIEYHLNSKSKNKLHIIIYHVIQ